MSGQNSRAAAHLATLAAAAFLAYMVRQDRRRRVWTLWYGPVPAKIHLTAEQARALGAGRGDTRAVNGWAPQGGPPAEGTPCRVARKHTLSALDRILHRYYVVQCGEIGPHTVHRATHFSLPGRQATAPLAGPAYWRWMLEPVPVVWPVCVYCRHPVHGQIYDIGHGPQHLGCHRAW